MSIFILNGKEIDQNEPAIPLSSRIYRYGDGFFESMFFTQKRIKHLAYHQIRIRKSAMLLQMEIPEDFNADNLEAQIAEITEKRNINSARVRCCFLRESAGLYTPIENNVQIIIEIVPLENSDYVWIEHGISLGFYKELTKNANFTSTIKTTSALIYSMAGLYAKKNQVSDCVIFNEFGRVSETISSNIFMVRGEFVITPPLGEFCVDGVMRKVVIQLAEAYGYVVSEMPITELDLISADEIFTTSAIGGIKYVSQIGQKRYKSNVSKVLHSKLLSEK